MFSTVNSVFPSTVFSEINDPDFGRFVVSLVAQVWKVVDTNSNGVQVEWSAFGMNLRFIGVSKVIGKMVNTVELLGRPLFSAERDWVNWWTAALANPYPIIPVE